MNRFLVLFFCLLVSFAFGQKKKNKGPNFDIADFNKKVADAEWLCIYDAVAWWTTDSAMAQHKEEIERLGSEWFCFQDESKLWHAVYGKYSNATFDLVFHFTVDSSDNVKRVYDNVDTLILNTHSRALKTAAKQLTELRDTVSLNFNQYIRKNDDSTFTVWILPAFQKNNVAIYGGEFIYKIDQTGNQILKDESYYQGKFRGFKVDKPREIWLDYNEIEKPTLGGVFFAWYYKEYFTSIYIDCSKSHSTPFKLSNNEYTWMTAEEVPEKKKK